jgi:hypothetical protein
LEFKPIAESMNIKIYASKENFLSFFNSPYYAHKQASAIDIYTIKRDYEEPALSPVDGKIVSIVHFKTPKPKHFVGSESDYIIGIESNENPNLWVRILHVKPKVKINQKISVGDEIGTYLQSGYFNFWTDPHIHVEIRNPNNIIRAKGGYVIDTLRTNKNELDSKEPLENKKFLEGKVKFISKRYIILSLKNPKLRFIRNFYGIEASIGNHKGILDCGFPHYGYGGIHLEQSNGIKKGDFVRFLGINIGIVVNKINDFIIFETIPLSVEINNKTLKGLSFYLYLDKFIDLKLVPIKPDFFDFKIGENLKVKITYR